MAALSGDEDTPIGHMLQTDGNKMCADCPVPIENDPWASINLGVLLCLKCSGLHRQLGTHISKVRSLKLDTKVWEDESTVAHMCSIGNTAFNTVWEWNRPPEFMLPQEFPGNDKVLQAYIFAKYKDRAFHRNEVMAGREVAVAGSGGGAGGGGGAPSEGFAVGSGVKFEGPVAKLSGGSGGIKMFGTTKWDTRTLQLSGDGTLKYLKGAEVKGAIPLEGATAMLLPEDEHSGKRGCFAVQTATTGVGGKDDGRRYDFHCEGSQDPGLSAVQWVQRIRFALSPRATMSLPPPPGKAFGATVGVPNCQLGQVVDQLVGHAQQWVETSALYGPVRCKQLGLPNDMGAWHDVVVVLTPWAFYSYHPVDGESNDANWASPCCCIPLQAADVVDAPGMLPSASGTGSEQNPACRFAMSFPLGFSVVSLPTPEQAAEFTAQCKDAVKTCEEAAGGKL